MKTPKGWRKLNRNEVLKPGDLWFSEQIEGWTETSFAGHAVGSQRYIRKKTVPLRYLGEKFHRVPRQFH